MKLVTSIFFLLLLTTITYTQTWVRQNPFANLTQLHDIDFSGKFGLAVGGDSVIYTTNNSGLMWVPRNSPNYSTIFTAALVVPGTMGQLMFAGGGDLLVRSKNGGETWTTAYSEIFDVFKIQALPGKKLLAYGRTFGMYSVDDGILWQPFNYPDDHSVTAAHFTSLTRGWVAFGGIDNTKIWYTNDGGFNWTVRDQQIFPMVTAIEMLNDSVGFLAARDFIYKTYDGGFSWHPLHTIATSHVQDLHVVNENNLWASLDNGSVYFSNIGGSVWEEINPKLINGNRTLGIWANAAGQVWMVGKYLSILHSPDFGKTWTDQIPGSKETLYSPDFANASVGMVGGSDGAILKTKNGGATWEPVHFPRDENFFGTAMINANTVVVGSSSGKVYKSSDFGETWTQLVQNLGPITDVHAFNSQVILLTNRNGDIYKTVDGGEIWSRMHNGALPLYAIEFYNSNLGWATGFGGTVLTTVDGGDEWHPQIRPGTFDFSDIHFTSTSEGWMTTSSLSDSIWHSTDGGISWRRVGLPIRSFWQGVTFKNRDTGWVIGGSDGNGVIYRTNDRGQSWFLDHTSPDPFMGIYSIANSETVWAVGFGGNIMKYSSCASPPMIVDLRGNLEPCIGDTINYSVEFDDVDVFAWTFPADWLVIGNTNTASIHFIAGASPGLVTVMGRDACGDTTDQLSAMVVPVTIPEINITENNGMLETNVNQGIFQWFLNGVPIPGANDPVFSPRINGTYHVHYTTFTSGCEAFSNTFKFGLIRPISVDIDNLGVYPNPAQDYIYIHSFDGEPIPRDSKVILTNLDGREVMTRRLGGNRIDIHDVPPGFYSLSIQTDKAILVTKIIIE